MESRLVAGSHYQHELHVTNANEDVSSQNGSKASVSVKSCKVCGDEIEVKENGEVFVACHVCTFPVCRPCYMYERSEGSQSCPQCYTRYKRHKGCPRVEGDDEDVGDLEDSEDEFQIKPKTAMVDKSQAESKSEYGEQIQQWKLTNGAAFSSFTGSVVGKELEGERETESNLEWKDRVNKWKTRQEKKGFINKEDNDNDDQDYDYEL